MQLQPTDLNITKENQNGNEATFSFSPLPTGFGHTLGNTLRRVLLTSLEGAAITQVKIDGVSHQFSTIDGVKEDVVEILLNFKLVRVKSHTQSPVVVRINKTGPGAVTAADIEETSDIEVLNKDQHLATLADKKTKFSAEVVIETGVGYSPTENRESSKIGILLLDALFSPVISAFYNVEPTRMGREIGLDKLLVTVETDGSITPEKAITDAATLLRNFFSRFSDGEDPKAVVDDVTDDGSQTQALVEDVALEELPLPTRTINALKKHGIHTLHQLAQKSQEELADVKNLGEKSILEIGKLLAKEGYMEDEA